MAMAICLTLGAVTIAAPIRAASGAFDGASIVDGWTENDVLVPSASSTYVLYDNFDRMRSDLWKVVSRANGPQGTNLLSGNVWVSGGKLTVKSDVGKHTGGEYQSKGTYGYGMYSARIKANLVPGSLAAFFTYASVRGGYNEIDIQFENKNGKYYVYFENAVNGDQSLYRYQLPFDPGAAYHTYAFNWCKGRIEFYVDDMSKPVYTSTSNVPDKPCYVLFNNWVSKYSSGSSGVSYLYVDWVSVASASPSPPPTPKPTVTPTPTPTPKPTVTPTPTPTPITNEPTPSTKYVLYDNFNKDSSNNWTKRSNVWSSSYVYTIFKPSNVWYENGKLVLRSYVDNHTGAEYKSNGIYSYGKYRASIKLSQTPGTYEAFFSYQWPTSTKVHNEIDIEFIKGTDGTTTAMLSTWVNYQYDRKTIKLSFDPSAGYHTYGYNWYPDRVEFYIDDMSKPVWTSYGHIPNEAMYVYFQNWVVKDVPSSHGDGVNTEYVDWVTVEPL
ncbi:Beta-glucanase/Beta-glucan synthetase [Methanocella conradii HZ254]|uniref:Beta-glucanase/Beta-glucan synthetase n=2 Tax=Methanocella TaxID=570266 RepID=H8I5J4_METCZ|nr:Beta-glucanase/Beta-glucan synthetase [Methanocella conradii HZ254]